MILRPKVCSISGPSVLRRRMMLGVFTTLASSTTTAQSHPYQSRRRSPLLYNLRLSSALTIPRNCDFHLLYIHSTRCHHSQRSSHRTTLRTCRAGNTVRLTVPKPVDVLGADHAWYADKVRFDVELALCSCTYPAACSSSSATGRATTTTTDFPGLGTGRTTSSRGSAMPPTAIPAGRPTPRCGGWSRPSMQFSPR